MKTTKDLGIALDRAVALLPEGRWRMHKLKGRRVVQYRAPTNGHQVKVQGTLTRCLYASLLAITEPTEFGGMGIPMEVVRDRIRLRPEGAPRMGTEGVCGHEAHMIRACALRGE